MKIFHLFHAAWRWAFSYRLTLLALLLAGQPGNAGCGQAANLGQAHAQYASVAMSYILVPDLSIGSLLFGIALIAAFVGIALQRRVARNQSAVIGEWLRREASLAKQYRELFENAKDAMLDLWRSRPDHPQRQLHCV